jgi:3-oxoacyl-[acyl-carrier protein] reductase
MAVIGITKTLSLNLAREGIRFNSLMPGWTATERVHEILEGRARRNSTRTEDEMAKQTADIPLGRMATPQEFANVATFLASPMASYVTGVMLLIDGGRNPTMF